jgi:hypothetical protein
MKSTKGSKEVIICKNCSNSFEGSFCNGCGQAADTTKINFHFLRLELQKILFHFDSGFIYSLKQLFTRPGHSVREYIEGKRIKHFKPFSLVILLATLNILLYHYFHVNLIAPSEGDGEYMVNLNDWILKHFSWISLATIPYYTVGTFICFRKQGYNFAEYLVLNTFKAAQKLTITIVTFPLIYLYAEIPAKTIVSGIIYLVSIGFMFWTNIQFFNKLSKVRTIFLSILSNLIFLVIFTSTIWAVLAILERTSS